MKNGHPEMPEEERKIILYKTDDDKTQMSLISQDISIEGGELIGFRR